MIAGFPRSRWRLCSLLAALLIAAGLAVGPEVAAQTPLVSPPESTATAPAGGPWQSLMHSIHETQRDLHRRLARAVLAIKGDAAGEAAAFLILLSFLYGIFHAAGPGHGKAVISTYLLANESAVKRGIVLAFLASFVQGLSAIGLVAILAVLLDMAGLRVTEAVGTLESASYALIALVGLWLLWSVLKKARFLRIGKAAAGAGHRHDGHACGHNHAPNPALLSREGLFSKAWAIVAAVGVRPCSGAVLVLLFTLAHGIFLAGVAATAAMSIGTAATVSALAVVTLYSKRLALAAMGARQRWLDVTYQLLGVGGAALLILLGGGLFLASLTGPGPL